MHHVLLDSKGECKLLGVLLQLRETNDILFTYNYLQFFTLKFLLLILGRVVVESPSLDVSVFLVPVSDIKSFVTGRDCPHIKDKKEKTRMVSDLVYRAYI